MREPARQGDTIRLFSTAANSARLRAAVAELDAQIPPRRNPGAGAEPADALEPGLGPRGGPGRKPRIYG